MQGKHKVSQPEQHLEVANFAAGKSSASARCSDLVFVRAEEECLHAHAQWSCSWAVPADGSYKAQAVMHRVLFCVEKKAIGRAVQQLAQLFQHDVSQHGLS